MRLSILLVVLCIHYSICTFTPTIIFGLNVHHCRVDVTSMWVCVNATDCRRALCTRQGASLKQIACLRFPGNTTAPQLRKKADSNDPFPHAILFAIHSVDCTPIRMSGRTCYNAGDCYHTAFLMQRGFADAFICQQSTDTRCFPPRVN